MIGTIVNTLCIVVGSVTGSILRRGIGEKYRQGLFTALGVATILLGANAFVHNMPKSQTPVLCIVSIVLGSLIGIYFDLAARFARLVDGKNSTPSPGRAGEGSKEAPRLSEGLLTGILLYCIGTFSMLGPVFSALQGDNTYLYTNATLDLISSCVLASTYGIGMVWAAPVLFCWQGMFYTIAIISATAISPQLMTELSIIGGILITASGVGILGLKDCKVLNMIPSFLIPVLFFLIKGLVG